MRYPFAGGSRGQLEPDPLAGRRRVHAPSLREGGDEEDPATGHAGIAGIALPRLLRHPVRDRDAEPVVLEIDLEPHRRAGVEHDVRHELAGEENRDLGHLGRDEVAKLPLDEQPGDACGARLGWEIERVVHSTGLSRFGGISPPRAD